MPHKAMQRHISPLAQELREAAQGRAKPAPVKLADAFGRVAGDEGEGKAGQGGVGGRQVGAKGRPAGRDRGPGRLAPEFTRAADDGRGEGEGGDGRTGGPGPASEEKAIQRGRRRDRHKDQERDREQERRRRRRRGRDIDRDR